MTFYDYSFKTTVWSSSEQESFLKWELTVTHTHSAQIITPPHTVCDVLDEDSFQESWQRIVRGVKVGEVNSPTFAET